MISERHGNLLAQPADAIVNTVNTVGVMGKGIALQFKRAFPENYKAYKRACARGEVQLGRMFVWDAGELAGTKPRYIINFPTKGHWRARSQLSDIEAGLRDLVQVVDELGVESIALPPLGCGHGGLDWTVVRPLIVQAFQKLPRLEVILFPPEGAPSAEAQPVRTDRPRMTTARAALIGILGQYLPFALEVTNVDIQKLMYFLQEAGEPLSLHYVKGRYGPYADNLRHLLASMEGHFIRGGGDQSAKALDVVPFEILPDALPEAQAELGQHAATRERFDRVLRLTEGFESTYGLELLATVHWSATRDGDETLSPTVADEESVGATVRAWNTRKGQLFTPRHVGIAYARLRDQGWFEQRDTDALLTV